MNKKISSGFDDMAVKLLSCVASDQSMTLNDAEGHKWESLCKSEDDTTITKIKRDGVTVAVVVYHYDTGEEETITF